MTGFLRWAGGTLILAAVVHLAVIFAYPYTAMNRLMANVEERAGGPNKTLYPPRPDPTSRRVVRPSPDLFYAICVFDVSGGPVRVRGPVAGTYWSLSLYAANSDNFYVVSEAGEGADWASVVLAKQGTDVTGIDLPVLTPPTTRGVALYRLLIDNPERADALDRLRKRADCGPLVK